MSRQSVVEQILDSRKKSNTTFSLHQYNVLSNWTLSCLCLSRFTVYSLLLLTVLVKKMCFYYGNNCYRDSKLKKCKVCIYYYGSYHFFGKVAQF